MQDARKDTITPARKKTPPSNDDMHLAERHCEYSGKLVVSLDDRQTDQNHKNEPQEAMEASFYRPFAFEIGHRARNILLCLVVATRATATLVSTESSCVLVGMREARINVYTLSGDYLARSRM